MSKISTITDPEVPWLQRLGGWGFAHFLRQGIKLLDVRLVHYDRSADPSQAQYSQPCICVFWHEYLALAVGQWAFYPVTMLVSRHRDAEWLTQGAERLGFSIVRGSTRRGGTQAIRTLRRFCKTHTLGITPDGPQGPRRQMAMGPVFLASLFQMPIVPVGFGLDNPWRANTWDRFAIARPFSRARIVFGPKIHLPPKMSREEMEAARVNIQAMIHRVTGIAETWARQGFDINGSVDGAAARRSSPEQHISTSATMETGVAPTANRQSFIKAA